MCNAFIKILIGCTMMAVVPMMIVPNSCSLLGQGTQIVYASKERGTWELWKMNLDGSGKIALTQVGPDAPISIAISPDGSKIAYCCNAPNLFVVDNDGSNCREILSSKYLWTGCWTVAWAGNDYILTCTGNTNNVGQVEILRIKVDGSEQENLTASFSDSYYHMWLSQDQSKIVYGRGIPYAAATGSIWIADYPTFANQYKVADAPGAEWSMSLSSNNIIAFHMDNAKISTVRTDGTGLTQVSPQESAFDFNPRISPNGSKILFISRLNGIDNVWTMNTDGSNRVQLTSVPAAGMITAVDCGKAPDITPPVLSLLPFRPLWPANHKYVKFTLSDMVLSVMDESVGVIDPENVSIISASSDEPEDAQGNGDGNTSDDIVIAQDGKSVQLRAERQGNGNGRVYTVNLSVSDPSANAATASYKVSVPKNQGNGSIAVDDGVAYVVNANEGLNAALFAGAGDGVETVSDIPAEFSLGNYPNPFNPSTIIEYNLPFPEFVSLRVFNLLGEQVGILVNEQKGAGSYRVKFDARNLPSGIYIYRIEAGSYVETKRMVLMK